MESGKDTNIDINRVSDFISLHYETDNGFSGLTDEDTVEYLTPTEIADIYVTNIRADVERAEKTTKVTQEFKNRLQELLNEED